MVPFAREALAHGQAECLPVEQPFSYFRFREKHFRDFAPLARILSQARCLNAKAMVIEEVSPTAAADLITETEDLVIRLGGELETQVIRLSFFAVKPQEPRSFSGMVSSKDFLGYAIVRKDVSPRLRSPILRVHESVLRSSRSEHNYVRRAPAWTCLVLGRKVSVSGFIYAQQNGITNVCAHAALRTMASVFYPEGDLSYRNINEVLRIDHRKNWVGVDLENPQRGRGLALQNMVEVLEYAGARCIKADYAVPFSQRGELSGFHVPYQHYLYGSIESGFPAAIIFDTTDDESKHVIPVFGHTFNRDLWVANAERSYFQIGNQTRFLPSDSWLSTFIMHDDNWGSNFCCPKHYLRAPDDRRRDRNSSESEEAKGSQESRAINAEWLAHVLATLPRGVKMGPIHAEAIGLDFLSTLLPQMPSDENEWSRRLINHERSGLVVYRPVLVTGDEYVDHLRKVRGWLKKRRISGVILEALHSVLGKGQYWMVEMSLPELFSSNLRKIGEVLLDPTATPRPERDFSSFVLARMPGNFALLENRDPEKPAFQFLPTGVNSHVELFGCEK